MSSITEEVIEFAKKQGADLVGIADLSQLDFPEGHNPEDYLPGAKSAVSVACRLSKGSLLNLPQSRNSYVLEHDTVNENLNRINLRINLFLEDRGYLALGIPGTASTGDDKRLAADLSHKHIAVAAGLGSFGINNLVLTASYGPGVRFSTIYTTARLEPTVSVRENNNIEKYCTECLKCVEICPANALDDWKGKYTLEEGWRVDKEKCYHQMFIKLSGKKCGLCIKACPLLDNRGTCR